MGAEKKTAKPVIFENRSVLLSSRGLSLVEMLIMIGLMSVFSLVMMTLFNQNLKSTSLLQDQLEATDLDRTIQSALRAPASCKKLLENLGIGPINSRRNIATLTAPGNIVLAQSNRQAGRLDIGRISFVNESVPGPNDSGFINIEVPIAPSSSMSLLRALKPLQFRVYVSTNASSVVESCTSGGMLSNCTVRPFTSAGDAGSSHCCETDEVFISGSAPLDPSDASFSWTNKRCANWLAVGPGKPIQMLCCK